jgi:hypothetical protein
VWGRRKSNIPRAGCEKKTRNEKEVSKDSLQEEGEPMHFDDRTQNTIADTHTNTDTNDAKWQPTEMFRTWPP